MSDDAAEEQATEPEPSATDLGLDMHMDLLSDACEAVADGIDGDAELPADGHSIADAQAGADDNQAANGDKQEELPPDEPGTAPAPDSFAVADASTDENPDGESGRVAMADIVRENVEAIPGVITAKDNGDVDDIVHAPVASPQDDGGVQVIVAPVPVEEPQSEAKPQKAPVVPDELPPTDPRDPSPRVPQLGGDGLRPKGIDQSPDKAEQVGEEHRGIFDDTGINREEAIQPKQRVPRAEPEKGPIMPPNEAELDQVLMNMVKKRVIPDPAIRIDVCNYGRKKSAKLMLAEEYDEAAKIDVAVDILFVSIRDSEAAQNADDQNAALKKRLENVRREEQEFAQSVDERVELQREELREKLRQLEEIHAQETRKFEQVWGAPEARIPYSKPSAVLLQVRQKQKAAALLHNYERAKAMKRETEALERIEAAEGAERFAAAFMAAYGQLLDQQQKEMECLIESSDLKITMLGQYREKELASRQLTTRSLETKLAIPKHMKKPTIRVPIVKPRSGTVATPGMITYRTRGQLATYRKAPEKRRLDVPARDSATMIRTSARKPPTAQTPTKRAPAAQPPTEGPQAAEPEAANAQAGT
jgi:cell fate (sporulation/competence/biofilm development) regulator YmcA (YheA/YmcA/DUF963 family)